MTKPHMAVYTLQHIVSPEPIVYEEPSSISIINMREYYWYGFVLPVVFVTWTEL